MKDITQAKKKAKCCKTCGIPPLPKLTMDIRNYDAEYYFQCPQCFTASKKHSSPETAVRYWNEIN